MSRRALSAGTAVLLVLGLAVVAAIGSGSPRQRPAAGPVQATSPTPTPTPAGEQDPAIPAEGIGEHLDALQIIANANDGNRAAGTPGDRATVGPAFSPPRPATLRRRAPAR